MGTLVSLLWKAIATLAAAVGAAVVARTYTETPAKTPVSTASGAQPAPSDQAPAEHEAAAEGRPGWSQPKPEIIPRSTYWPVVFAGGISFIFWGLISNIWIFGAGLILFVVAAAGWVGDLINE